uniref:Putative secreted protein n=1 Tax=Amblyomma triste TaxID=251400 RepID=A0A023GDQ7_AMBTT
MNNRMKSTLMAVCILGFLATVVSGETAVEEEAAQGEVQALYSEETVNEALLVGHILRDVALDLKQDADVNEVDEYFFRKLWDKTKLAMKQASKKIKVVSKKVGPGIKKALKAAGKLIVKATIEVVKKKAQEKATEYVTKIFSKALSRYALEDVESNADFVQRICRDIDLAGQQLIERGEQLGGHRLVYLS